ncbi:MAG: Gfo/Idh/MocA family oxidoreductase, partial [Acidimicrobiales bacterium]
MTTNGKGEIQISTRKRDEPVGVGIIGCGNIFGSYINGLRKLPSVRVLGCADLDQARAEASAKAEDVRAYPGVGALLADEAVEIVVNITWPLAHAAISTEALSAGKHVYSEKPLGATLADAGLACEA